MASDDRYTETSSTYGESDIKDNSTGDSYRRDSSGTVWQNDKIQEQNSDGEWVDKYQFNLVNATGRS